uniref:Immunoglobulin V-set domain-containing protein n=1 Tax=Takifugu rubripes TaxID=31033 RepID=A0A674MNB2_TAKRU
MSLLVRGLDNCALLNIGAESIPFTKVNLRNRQRVTGHAGEDVSFRCSGNWTTENSSEHLNVFFCKGMCSRENTIIQSPGTTAAVVRMGRYSLQPIRGDGALEVNITKLKPADAGRYYCGVGDAVIVLYQEVNLKICISHPLFHVKASTVPPGSAALTSTTLQAAANTDSNLFLPTAEPSPFTQPTARGKTNPRAAARLSGWV